MNGWKIGAIIGAIVFLVALLWIIKIQSELLEQQKINEKYIVEMKQLEEKIVRNQSSYVSKKDLENFAKSNGLDLSIIKRDLNKLSADVKSISKADFVTPGFNGTRIPSTFVIPNNSGINPPIKVDCPDGTNVTCPNPDKFNYLSKTPMLTLDEPFSDGTTVPFGNVGFSASEKDPWTLKIYPRKYSTTTVLGEDENGRQYAYTQFSIESNGKKKLIKADEAKFVQEYPESKFRFSPHLYFGLDAGVNLNDADSAIVPSAQLFLFSHSRTKVRPNWAILGVGAGFEAQDKDLTIVVSPFKYNVGKKLPLVDNVYLGPTVGFTTESNFLITGGVHVGL